MENEFPKMLYRDGSEITVEGVGLDYLIVDNADAQAAAESDGWHEGPESNTPKRGRPRKEVE